MPADRDSCELLRAIARYPSGDVPQQIYQLADKIRDWDSLLSLAQEHRVLPMLVSRFADMGPAVPSAVQDRLQIEYHRNVFHCLANAVELISVLEAFDHEKIPAMPFKGVVLAASIYHNLTARSAGDLDLLIHYNDLVRATAILQKRGYALKTPVHPDKTPAVPDCYEYHFERQADGMVLELRWRLELTQPRFRRNLGMDWVWPRRRTAMLAGTPVPDMNSETKLLVLCMHGSKHIWSRLIWICDVAQLLNASPDLDWQDVIEEAKRSGLWRALVLGILLAHRVAGAAVPPAVLRRFESDTTARRLAQLIQDNLFDAPGSLPTGRMPYNVQLLGFDDRLKMLLSPDFLQPNVRDQAAIPLPKSLYALYYLIRPFRILWDRSAR
jgi:Uncharacterised nucleotidyltransferase